jgi:virulence-associated protein VagC
MAMGAHETRTFRSGKGVALRLPDSFAVAPGEKLLVEQDGDRITLRRPRDHAEAVRKLRSLLAALEAIGRGRPAARPPDSSKEACRPELSLCPAGGAA